MRIAAAAIGFMVIVGAAGVLWPRAAPWYPPNTGTVRALPPVVPAVDHGVDHLQVSASGTSIVVAWLSAATGTIRVAESHDRGVHFLPARVVARLDGATSSDGGHLGLAVRRASHGVHTWRPGADALRTLVSWTSRPGEGGAWASTNGGAFEAAPVTTAFAADTWSALSAGVNTFDPWRTTLVPNGPGLRVSGLFDEFGGATTPQIVEGPSPGDRLVYIGVERDGNAFGVWSGREGLLRIQRHPNVAHRASVGTDLPLVLARSVADPVRVAATATDWGVVVAWVDAAGTGDRIALREVTFDVLCLPAAPSE